jgi:hypothetical protein
MPPEIAPNRRTALTSTLVGISLGAQRRSLMRLQNLISLALCLLLGAAALAQENTGAKPATAFYHGTIGRTLEVQMTLTRRGSDLTGSYEYESQRKPIPLRGRVLTSGDYEIDELDGNGKATAKFSLSQIFVRHLDGTWLSKGKKLPVVLGEITSAQLQQLHDMWSGSHLVKNIAVGPVSACALTDSGTFCWGLVLGSPSLAAAGPGMVAYRALPQLLIPADITALALGEPASCFIRHGAVYCWQPRSSELRLTEPTLIPGFEKDVTAVGISGGYVCALAADALKCWPGKSLDPATVVTVIASGVTRMAAGMPNCVLAGGKVLCWNLGDHWTPKPQPSIQEIEGIKGEIQSLAAYDLFYTKFACAVTFGSLQCWGDDIGNVLLGRRVKSNFRNLPPAAMPAMDTGVTDVSLENLNACAIQRGKVLCWGSNWYGLSGDGTTAFTSGPVEVSLPSPALKVAVGADYVCASTADHHIWCWGDNEFGQTGNASRDTCEIPNGNMPDTIPTPCNKRPVEVLGIP